LDRVEEGSDAVIPEKARKILLFRELSAEGGWCRITVKPRPESRVWDSPRRAFLPEPPTQQVSAPLVADKPLSQVGCVDPNSASRSEVYAEVGSR
jgi:hypothetical protein